MKRFFSIIGICAAGFFQPLEIFAADTIAPPSPEVVATFKLATNYTKCVIVENLPVVGSAKVSDFAMREAVYLVRHEIGNRPEILRAMAGNNVRLVVMASTEMTTDVPEHSDLTPKEYWNRRARGLGATEERPAVSCAEENLLCLAGDPYWQENILIHEFAHAIHERGMISIDPAFDKRLTAAFEHARTNGLWKGTYSMENRMEYWAEGAQAWFDTARKNDFQHGPIDTRDLLKPYDPDLAKLLAEVFGDSPWRYAKPAKRPESERAHLAGFDAKNFPRFEWPKNAPRGEALAWLSPDKAPAASPRSSEKTSINFMNFRKKEIEVSWIDFDGKRKRVKTVRSGLTFLEESFSGHAFVISEDGKDLGAVVATDGPGRVEIK